MNAGRRSATTTKIFVASLPAGTTADELRELFAPYGEIAECDVVNRCGFLHLEDKSLAFKAINELNNTTFKGTSISVEKGHVKPNRDRPGMGGRGGFRNGFSGPMRGGRDNYRSGPYMRDSFDRPPRGGLPRRGGFGGGGFDRGFNRGPGPMNRNGPGPMNDGYTNGGGDRRGGYMNDRSSGGYGNNNYSSSGGYGGGMNSGTGNMYNDNYNMNYDRMDRGGMNRGPALFDRRPPMMDKSMDDRGMMGDRRPPMNDRAPPMGMDDRRGGPMMGDRRPLIDNQGSGMGGPQPVPPPSMQGFDRRPQGDMFSRRDPPQKTMGGGYGEAPRNQYEVSYPPIQNRSFADGPGPRRDMPPVRRFL